MSSGFVLSLFLEWQVFDSPKLLEWSWSAVHISPDLRGILAISQYCWALFAEQFQILCLFIKVFCLYYYYFLPHLKILLFIHPQFMAVSTVALLSLEKFHSCS